MRAAATIQATGRNVSREPNFCPGCGQQREQAGQFCPNCGSRVKERPDASTGAQIEVGPVGAKSPPQANWLPCPGCVQTKGPPGAICPNCGSRFPNPSMKEPAQGLAVLGVVLILLAVAINGVSEDAATWIGVIGVLSLIGAGAAWGSYSGRVGPQPEKGSCCGCSCLVLVLAIPLAGLLLWSKGGPELAILALPVGPPIIWVLDRADRLASSAGRKLRRALEP